MLRRRRLLGYAHDTSELFETSVASVDDRIVTSNGTPDGGIGGAQLNAMKLDIQRTLGA
jgi:hypothetical protein